MANHYPIFGRKVPTSCNDAGGTANPFAAVTCPHCRDRLHKSVQSKRDGAMTFSERSQERSVFLANAAALEKVLAA